MGKKKLKKGGLQLEEKKAPQPSSSNKNQADLYSQIFSNTESEGEDDSPPSEIPSKNLKAGRSLKLSPLKNQERALAKGKVKASTIGSKKSPQKITVEKAAKVEKRLPVMRSMKAAAGRVDDDSSESEAGDYEFDEDDDDDEKPDMEIDEAQESEDSDAESEEEESDDSEDELDEDDDSIPKTALRKQLKDLSFEELESLKQKMGLKEYNEAMFAATKQTGPKNKRKRKFERSNKNRPREISSKIRVPKLRQIVKVKKKITKDPRFDDTCGEYNEKFWNTEYNFIRDIQKKEAEEMKTTIKSVGDKSKKNEMRRFIQRVNDKEKSIEAKKSEEKKRIQDKEENKKRALEGKRPFYMKKSTKKLVELVEKYDELKASGKLDKYLKKKRKKNAFRDKKTLSG